MLMKRPQNYVKFRHVNVKRYSLTLDKRFHEYPTLFRVACHVFEVPRLKARIEKVGNGHE
jgi:hypothetical protein